MDYNLVWVEPFTVIRKFQFFVHFVIRPLSVNLLNLILMKYNLHSPNIKRFLWASGITVKISLFYVSHTTVHFVGQV
jgi:homoserine trans-succinylase